MVRNAHAERPSRVEYELTSPGRTLLDPVDALDAWALEAATRS
ncbi:winged helix-turn-helix transcriptional regulator [Streptomyces sp. NPDC021080]